MRSNDKRTTKKWKVSELKSHVPEIEKGACDLGTTSYFTPNQEDLHG